MYDDRMKPQGGGEFEASVQSVEEQTRAKPLSPGRLIDGQTADQHGRYGMPGEFGGYVLEGDGRGSQSEVTAYLMRTGPHGDVCPAESSFLILTGQGFEKLVQRFPPAGKPAAIMGACQRLDLPVSYFANPPS